ncbi:MAG: bifunctional adenosylcobinamide kinase/adenosylcobinamide-phosphate guanylyltransferase [Ornithinimicrobium sp.]|uniref:bifunctional adenosylcobinamide kinase/adenosylcobinamide-phosphate guanylyltransferase n=1 Tax=Ornithinimicrobium sp. TaxID=1977084 RepID=UPI0026DFD00D|nr:bifunctional adenosylcobinamide kinase/adenosylcobinamide-phosphate guanylyltransferase [Ornithinimicrobium sp.]MDO5741073.1 bifunctional adenosylcobinamide kinase/adenosylcobinamide-phosphate guanylyltransferase [Ornithinimicrobium sp.]
MTTTLVVGKPHADRAQHAQSLLSAHPQVTLVSTREHPEAIRNGRPDQWSLVETFDLTRALLSSRSPVLIDDLPGWVDAVLDDRCLRDDPEGAHQVISGLADELCLALSAVPFETVTLTSESLEGTGDASLRDQLVSYVNARVASVSGDLHAVVLGRVIDLSSMPLVGRV